MKPTHTEHDLVDLLVAGFPRSPLQINATHESDAELLRLDDDATPGEPGTARGPVLAVTVDSIEEEISAGLYDDPYMIGWVACMASLSDLAATGASPLGILMAETLPPDYPEDLLRRLQDGIRDACREAGTFLLGGDTNAGRELRLTGCALGLAQATPLLRVGMRPGDMLFSTGPFGSGNAYALERLLGGPDAVPPFNPAARLAEGRILAGFARVCMDSSDGLFTTLSELMRLNRVGVALDAGWESWIERAAVTAAERHGLPAWCMLAGEHGEYELVFALSPRNIGRISELAQATGRQPIPLGTVTAEPGLRVWIDGLPATLDLPGILETVGIARTDPAACLEGLRAMHDRIMTESAQNRDRVRHPVTDIAV